VGTNSYSTLFGSVSITWSRNTPNPHAIHDALSEHEVRIADALDQKGVITSQTAKEALGKYGLVDEAGRLRLYLVSADSEAVKAYLKLGEQFGGEVMSHIDVPKVVKMIDAPPGVAFLIVYHEVCWQLLHELAQKGSLPVPELVARAGADVSKARELVTLAIMPRIKDPFLQTAMSEPEKAAIQHFDEIKGRIAAGEKYFNLSTPVDTLLTLISAVAAKDADAYQKANPGAERPQEFSQGWIDGCKQMCIYRVEPWSKTPAEGDVRPVYVMDRGEKDFSDIQVFIYRGGQWQKLFDLGNPRADWRQAVEAAKNHLK
jgi:hypothetical protein